MRVVLSRVLQLGLLGALYVLPVDMTTFGFFVIAFFVFLGALRALVRHRRHPRVVVVVSLLTAVLFPGSCVNQLAAWSVASDRVNAIGDVAHAHCRREGVCPTIEEVCGGPDCGTAGTTVRHVVRYARSADGKRFTAWSRLTIDDQVSVEGGVEGPLVRVRRMDNEETRTVVEADAL